jgi:predicted XRE-type DNA-binding protein
MATTLRPTIRSTGRTRPRVEQQLEKLSEAIARDIASALEAQGISQTDASHIVGEAPSQLSLVCTGKLRGFSLERLIRIRALLGASVTVTVVDGESAAVKVSIK